MTMLPDPQDTIVALSTAPGPGARAIVRLSGQRSLTVAHRVFQSCNATEPEPQHLCTGEIRLPDIASPLPADLYFWKAPRSFTGQDVVELHTISSPPLIELLIAACLNAGARAAQPGEFTMRAFLAGKLDLTRAEAILGVIEAGSRDELKQALVQLAGGMTRPLHELREDLLNLLADVEAALDFADEHIEFVQKRDLLVRLAKGLALVTILRRQLEQRAIGDRPFRVVLAGRPNAGKSSLFNALAGSAAALVSPEPGTTRDYLLCRVNLAGVTVELIDTAGWRPGSNGVEGQAQKLGREQFDQADLVLLCVEGGKTTDEEKALLESKKPPVIGLATKRDLNKPPADWLGTSVITQEGLPALRELLGERARAHNRPALAPSLSRCHHHVDACLEHLRRAHANALHDDPPELLALELRGALDELGAMAGAVYTDDLLDRIFSRFCIGK
ncbi:MAG TPA: tRNA uridine-5-carboxymethylaminomethyl(34) synthesis GTPase MnmE [Gemmataceae bacterium]|nr:tRNA uridine-5-carboxymethylaminomethyl(34) synthesis GTPase MnmE [Gemmataceae bacterium]